MNRIGMTIEIELGVTGGEEDGVDNTDIDTARLYTQPEEVNQAYEILSEVSNRFTVAAAFGNVHGVYKPGNVELTPKILLDSQEYLKEKHGLTGKPVHFVFHGGSGSSREQIREAIGYGVVKMNLDTDMQWAFWDGVHEYYKENKDYLQGQLATPRERKSRTRTLHPAHGLGRVSKASFLVSLVLLRISIASTGTLADLARKP